MPPPPPPSGNFGQPPAAPGNNPKALWAMISGIFSLLCCGPLGILALVLGLSAKKEIQASGGAQTGGGMATAGIVLVKFWLHISAEEQLRRFKEREKTPWKQHKITDEDWRNREKWDGYEAAVNEMVARTSTEYAPWTVVAANDKRAARIEVVRTVSGRLGTALGD